MGNFVDFSDKNREAYGVELSGPLNTKKRVSYNPAAKTEDFRALLLDGGKINCIFMIIDRTVLVLYNKRVAENLLVSLMITIIRDKVTVYGLTDQYEDTVRLLYNRYLMLGFAFLRDLDQGRGSEILKNRNRIQFSQRWKNGK